MLSSRPGDTVFDPFAGSGSSGVAADICGRNWIGCEKDTDMFEKADDWLNNIDYELAKEYIDSRVHNQYPSGTNFQMLDSQVSASCRIGGKCRLYLHP